MDEIVSSLEADHEVILNCEVINDDGKVSVLKGNGIFMPDLKCRLLIPQDHFMKLQRLNNPKFSFTTTLDKSILKLSDQVPITIHYEKTTGLQMLHDYRIIYITAYYLDITGCVTTNKKQNLT